MQFVYNIHRERQRKWLNLHGILWEMFVQILEAILRELDIFVWGWLKRKTRLGSMAYVFTWFRVTPWIKHASHWDTGCLSQRIRKLLLEGVAKSMFHLSVCLGLAFLECLLQWLKHGSHRRSDLDCMPDSSVPHNMCCTVDLIVFPMLMACVLVLQFAAVFYHCL